MDNLISQFNAHCKPVVSPYGFKKKKNVFVRVINDVCQSFYLEKLSKHFEGRECRIGFVVLPLCQKLEASQVYDGLGIDYLRKFEISPWTSYDGWYYREDPDSISACVNEMMRFIKLHLLPFFQRADCCKTALPEQIKVEELFNNNRVVSLNLEGMEDLAAPGSRVRFADSAKYFMALKNGNYAFALKSRKTLERINHDSYNSLLGWHDPKDDIMIERMKDLTKLREEIKRLEEGDYSFFQQIIVQNEEYSRKSLSDIL